MKKRGLTTSRKKSATNVWGKLFWGALFVVISSFQTNDGLAQQSNANISEKNGAKTLNASSVLSSTFPNGRIGGSRYDGTLSPNQERNSRFISDNATSYGDVGDIVGIDRTSSSRFNGSVVSFQPKKSYDLLALRNEYYRARERTGADYRTSQIEKQDEPRLVVATSPKVFPYASERIARYGKIRERELAERGAIKTSAERAFQDRVSVPQHLDSAQRIWMRGVAPVSEAITPDDRLRTEKNDLDDSGLWDYSWQFETSNTRMAPIPGIEPGGSFNAQTDFSGALSFSNIRTPEDVKHSFIENLETQLLSSPDVNPLSPIQVAVENGVATVRGVVPTPRARVMAGRILLSNPQIIRVNNLLTCIRNDDPKMLGVPSVKANMNDTSIKVPQLSSSNVQ